MVTEHLVRKQDGTFWRVVYGADGIKWLPVDRTFEEGGSGGDPLTPGPQFGGSGPIQAIASITQAAGEVGQWWEVRQQRLLVEAAREQTQRIDWLTEAMGRWAEIHRGGGQLDLRISEYLAREARAFAEVAGANKRVAMPQLLLYELDVIQDSFRSVRRALGSQFEALIESREIDVHTAVREVLPGHRLNVEFIRRLASEPSTMAGESARGRGRSVPDEPLANAFRLPDDFLGHLFMTTQVSLREDIEPSHKGVLDRVVDAVTGSLPWIRWEDAAQAETAERREYFRELLLLPAEFSRVRALHSAWQATTAAIAESVGEPVGVLLGTGGIAVQLGLEEPDQSSLTASLAGRPALLSGSEQPQPA